MAGSYITRPIDFCFFITTKGANKIVTLTGCLDSAINWGDGTTTTGTGEDTHAYIEAGSYVISVLTNIPDLCELSADPADIVFNCIYNLNLMPCSDVIVRMRAP